MNSFDGHSTMLAGALAVATLFAAPAHAQSVAEFYAGKSITMAIGFAPGGGYDLYGRLVARQAHPRQSADCAAEHARRRQHAGSAASLFARP
jgi:tripartite-type tricarboxylate transporter receptor subunit TctC